MAGVVSYLQKTNLGMLRFTAPDAPDSETVPEIRVKRSLWVALAVLMLATLAGILAVGSAWGEWKAGDFKDAARRTEIRQASAGASLPENVPHGLERFGEIWKAPLKDYSPPFIRNTSASYLASASIGVGLILGLTALAWWYVSRRTRKRDAFIEKTVAGLVETMRKSLFAENTAQLPGILQSLDPK